MNSRLFRRIKTLVAASGVVLFAGACGEVAGVDDMGRVEVALQEATVEVSLQEATAEALFNVMVGDLSAAPGEAAGRVDRDNVILLEVTVNGMQILPYCEEAEEDNGDGNGDGTGEQNGDGECEGMWEELPLEEGSEFVLDLLALPSEEEDAIVLAEGIVPVGEYHKIRLFISEAYVAFETPVSVGRSNFEAYNFGEGVDEEDPATWYVHSLEIPSARNTGIKADIDLVVEEGAVGDVGLLFDADATFRNVIATGSGRIKMPPVLKVRPMYQNEEQEQNQNQNGG